MPTYKKHKLRIICCLISVCMTLSSVAYSAPIAPIPADVLMAKVPMSHYALDPAKVDLPLEHVTLKEVHKGGSGKLIIHIQDAHANLSGQKSLAKALDELMKKYELNLVMVEGSARDSSLHSVRKLAPLKEWGIIARRFLFDGIISGEEFLNLTTEHDMRIVGVEYRDLYDDAIKAYAALVDQRKDILHYLYKSKQAVDKLKQRLYPISLLDYENKKRQNEEDGGDFKASFEALMTLVDSRTITKQSYPEILKLTQMHQTESAIDFNQANKEQMVLMRKLKDVGASEAVKEFMASSKRVRNVQLSQYFLMKKILSVAKEKGINTDEFSQLTAYVNYLRTFTDLELEKLLNELDVLEDATYMNILKDDEAKKARAIDRFLGLLGNAYKLQMSSNEFKMLKFNEGDFPTESWLAFLNQQLVEFGFFEQVMPYKTHLEKARESLGEFYTLVDKRDEAFVQNAKQIMHERKEDAAVLIAGGYHTAHLTELLREQDISYMVLTPVVTDKTDHEKYEKLLLAYVGQQEQKISEMSGAFSAQNVAITKAPRGIRRLSRVSSAEPQFGAVASAEIKESLRTGYDPLIDLIPRTLSGLAESSLPRTTPQPDVLDRLQLDFEAGLLAGSSKAIQLSSESAARFNPYQLYSRVGENPVISRRLDLDGLNASGKSHLKRVYANVPSLAGSRLPLGIAPDLTETPDAGSAFVNEVVDRVNRGRDIASSQGIQIELGVDNEPNVETLAEEFAYAFRAFRELPSDVIQPVMPVYLGTDMGAIKSGLLTQEVRNQLDFLGRVSEILQDFGSSISIIDDTGMIEDRLADAVSKKTPIVNADSLISIIRASQANPSLPRVVFVASYEKLNDFLGQNPELRALVEASGVVSFTPVLPVVAKQNAISPRAIPATMLIGPAALMNDNQRQEYFELHREFFSKLGIENADQLSVAALADPTKDSPVFRAIAKNLPTITRFINTVINRLKTAIAAVATSA